MCCAEWACGFRRAVGHSANRNRFPPRAGEYEGDARCGDVAEKWRIVSTENNASAPQTPAASLLFQAPAFQAPVFQEAPHEREAAPQEAPIREKKTRSRRKAEPADAQEAPAEESAPAAPETPKRKRRTRKDKDADAQAAPVRDEAAEQPSEAPQTDDSASDADETEEGTSRRRRRRSRSTEAVNDAEPDDEVKALKGSTRLEAKKQRRREGRKEGRRRHGITESEFLARRESVNRSMVIRDHEGLDQIAILEDGLLVEHYVARRTQKSMVGNIYLGRVQNVLPSMEAAFVDIGRGRNAVLYAGEVNWDAVGLEGKQRRIESALKSGDPVLVQVTKDPIGHKGARLTSQITLAGRYLVLIPNGSMMGISRKLPDRERSRLKKILKQIVPQGAGVIVRTAAEGASEEQIRDDVARLAKQWADIEKKQTQTKNAPVLLRGEPELAVRVVRDIFNEDFGSLIIQGLDTYDTVKSYIDELSPELSGRVEKWVGTDDVFAANRIDEQLSKGMDRKVWLPSGGTLIIDRTEAMTVIDVNTGKFIGHGGTLEETVTRNNLEAAEEIVRQLRLRDIGGIIIVDFVDMVLESNRDLVLRRLVECLGRDRTRHQVTEITSLGLVQMTRKRVGEGLVEAFSTPCEACEGRGFIVHSHPVELSGAQDRTGGSKSSKRKKNQVELRRIEDDAEHAKAKKALSAIAAATRKAEEEPSEAADTDPSKAAGTTSGADEPATAGGAEGKAPRPRRRRRVASESVVDAPVVAETVGGAATPVEPAPEPVKRPRRRRAVAASSTEPQAQAPVVTLELPARVEQSPEAATQTTDMITLPEAPSDASVPKTKRRRRVASTGVVNAG